MVAYKKPELKGVGSKHSEMFPLGCHHVTQRRHIAFCQLRLSQN